MARTPKPWFWEERQAYFVTIRGTRHNLGSDRDEATRLFHALMAEKPKAAPPRPSGGITVAEVIDLFLDWCQKHRAGKTYDFYREHLQNFLDVSDSGRLAASDLKPHHVSAWADSHLADWSGASRRGAIVAAQRPFNWAVKMGHLAASPIPHLEKPRAQRREQVISAEDWARIRASYPAGDCFVEMLEFCWETGCRPQEAKAVEARHVDLPGGRVVFPPQEAKGRRRVRVIYLTARAAELLAKRLPGSGGPLFVNRDGLPWTAYAMSCRFARLRKRLGVKFRCGAWRHSFATRKLVEGHDHLTVAELLGHANGRMLAETYQHLGGEDRHLRKALGD